MRRRAGCLIGGAPREGWIQALRRRLGVKGYSYERLLGRIVVGICFLV